jgi:hypothetical protein
MIEIELTIEQRRVLQAGPSRPVDVVDPATRQRYVLLAREQYERVRSLVEGSSGQAPPPAASAAPSPEQGEPPRVRLRDLPTPAEVAEDAERWCKKYDWGGKASRRGVEEQLKLQYYYGGQAIYLLRSPEGPVVLPIPERYRNTPDLRYVLLTAEERSRASSTIPPRWRDTISEILS